MDTTDEFVMNPGWDLLLADIGIPPARVLKRADLPENLFSVLPVVLSSEEYFRFFKAMDAEVGDDELPIRIIKAMTSEVFSPPLFAAICSPNLIVGARRVAKYKALTGPWKIETAEKPNEFAIGLSWPVLLDPPSSLILSELLFWLGLMRLTCRTNVNATCITAPAAPRHQTAYMEFTGVNITQGPDAVIVFSRDDAEAPFLTANDAMWRSFEPSLTHRLDALETSAPLSEQVRAHLLEAIPSGNVSAEFAAQKLRLGTRTLQRRLRSENVTFQNILNDTRYALAEHYLTKTHLAVAEIAFLLGFDDPNSFYRAFKGWAGTTPEQVRKSKRVPNR